MALTADNPLQHSARRCKYPPLSLRGKLQLTRGIHNKPNQLRFALARAAAQTGPLRSCLRFDTRLQDALQPPLRSRAPAQPADLPLTRLLSALLGDVEDCRFVNRLSLFLANAFDVEQLLEFAIGDVFGRFKTS